MVQIDQSLVESNTRNIIWIFKNMRKSMQLTRAYEHKYRKKTFLVNFCQPETLLKRKTKISFILVIHVQFELFREEPLHYKSPCGNHYVERFRFLCQSYSRNNWCYKLGEFVIFTIMIRLKYVIDMTVAVSFLWRLIFTANVNH